MRKTNDEKSHYFIRYSRRWYFLISFEYCISVQLFTMTVALHNAQ